MTSTAVPLASIICPRAKGPGHDGDCSHHRRLGLRRRRRYSGGLKTFSALGVYRRQRHHCDHGPETRGVTAVEDVSAEICRRRWTPSSPISTEGRQIGMVSRRETIAGIADGLRRSGKTRRRGFRSWLRPPATRCFGRNAVTALIEELLPLRSSPRPNLAEAA